MPDAGHCQLGKGFADAKPTGLHPAKRAGSQ